MLSALLSSLDHGPNTIIDSKSDGNYNHNDARESAFDQCNVQSLAKSLSNF